MIHRHIILTTLVFLSSCSLSDIYTQPTQTDTGSMEYQPPLVENLSGTNDEYNPIFNGLESKVINIDHRSGTPTKVAFINSEATVMRVVVSFPDGQSGNLRWSQVIMPDGTMDGPFGQDTRYDLTQFGGYELIFNENNMSGDPWTGKATITITLQK